jgi:hypothetical protein
VKTVSATLGSREIRVATVDHGDVGRRALAFAELAVLEPGERLEVVVRTAPGMATSTAGEVGGT